MSEKDPSTLVEICLTCPDLKENKCTHDHVCEQAEVFMFDHPGTLPEVLKASAPVSDPEGSTVTNPDPNTEKPRRFDIFRFIDFSKITTNQLKEMRRDFEWSIQELAEVIRKREEAEK